MNARFVAMVKRTRREHVALSVAIAMLLFRFAYPGALTFINDEPNILRAAHDQLAPGGRWVEASPIFGTQGLRYGPVPTWFYGVVEALFGASAFTCIRAMTFAITAAQGALAYALTRTFAPPEHRVATGAALVALIASSPYTFLWSRQAWDNPLLAVCAALVVVTLARAELGLVHAVVVGLLLGCAVGTHLMVGPLVACATGMLAFALRKRPLIAAAAVAIVGACIALVNARYFQWVLAHRDAATKPPSLGAAELVELIPVYLAEPARVASLWHVDYFFGPAWSDFRAWFGPAFVLFDLATLPGVIAVACAGALGFVALRGRAPEQRRIGWLGLLAWALHATFLASRHLELHPHYAMPLTWLVPAGAAALFAWAGGREVRRRATMTAVWVVAIAQFAFVLAWTRWSVAEQGTREIHFASPLAQQTRAVREACTRASTPEIRLSNGTVLYATSLEYVASTEAACAGKHLTVCSGRCGAEPAATVFTLRYAGERGGALRLE